MLVKILGINFKYKDKHLLEEMRNKLTEDEINKNLTINSSILLSIYFYNYFRILHYFVSNTKIYNLTSIFTSFINTKLEIIANIDKKLFWDTFEKIDPIESCRNDINSREKLDMYKNDKIYYITEPYNNPNNFFYTINPDISEKPALEVDDDEDSLYN